MVSLYDYTRIIIIIIIIITTTKIKPTFTVFMRLNVCDRRIFNIHIISFMNIEPIGHYPSYCFSYTHTFSEVGSGCVVRHK